MKLQFLLISILSVSGLYADGIGSRILGGENAANGKAPSLVSLQDSDWNHICSGVLLDTRSVLTSASCAANPKVKNVVITTGTLIPKKVPTNAFHILRAVPHPDYYGDNLYDIGYIRTIQSMPIYNLGAQCASFSSQSVGPGNILTISGWDLTVPATSYRLKALNLTSLSYEQCVSDSKPDTIVDITHLCGIRSAGKGTCLGDNGLPVMSNGLLEGIVGEGPESKDKCATGYPEIYTKIAPYYYWIFSERNRY